MTTLSPSTASPTLNERDRRPHRTPEERAAAERRGARSNAAVSYLLLNLFGWKNIEYLTQSGEGRTTRRGQYAASKGWYGTNPKTKAREMYRHQIGTQLEASRKVIEAMETRGFSFALVKPAGKPWKAAFIVGYGGKAQTTYAAATDAETDEPLAICEAAVKALKGEAAKTGKP